MSTDVVEGTVRGLRCYMFPPATVRIIDMVGLQGEPVTNRPPLQYLRGGRRGRWYSPRQKARCMSKPNKLPGHNYLNDWRSNGPAPCDDPAHMCGINMYDAVEPYLRVYLHTHTSMPSEWSAMSISAGSPRRVLGLTEGWGRVIRHDWGYRCGQAEVAELVMLNDRPMLSNVAELYRAAYSRMHGWKNVPMREFTDPFKFDAYVRAWLSQGKLTLGEPVTYAPDHDFDSWW